MSWQWNLYIMVPVPTTAFPSWYLAFNCLAFKVLQFLFLWSCDLVLFWSILSTQPCLFPWKTPSFLLTDNPAYSSLQARCIKVKYWRHATVQQNMSHARIVKFFQQIICPLQLVWCFLVASSFVHSTSYCAETIFFLLTRHLLATTHKVEGHSSRCLAISSYMPVN